MSLWILQKMTSLFLSVQARAGSFMPTQGTEIAKSVDNLYEFLLIISLISCVIVIGGMIYFAIKYKRKSDNDKTAYITHDTRLEVLWSVIPLILFLFVLNSKFSNTFLQKSIFFAKKKII